MFKIHILLKNHDNIFIKLIQKSSKYHTTPTHMLQEIIFKYKQYSNMIECHKPFFTVRRRIIVPTYGTFTADLIRHLLHTVSLYVLFDTARSRLFYLTFLSLSRIVYL